MCGILGYTGPARPGMLERASRLIAHRGPDDAGTWSADAVHLAHRRLAIQDLSAAGHQPMVSASGRFVLVYNGEVYNAPELRRELEAEGVRFRSTSDTEVVLEAFARRGTAVFGQLNGIFALAIWDLRERRLTLARDHFGVKPLYVARFGGHLAFCSELKGLLAFPEVDRTLDPEAVDQLLTFLWVPQPRTVLRGVEHLPAGHLATFSPDTGAFEVERYWGRDELGPGGTARVSEGEATERTRFLLERAVRRQLLSDVPVGAFLSGGLDSSLVVAGMTGTTERVRAYTIDFGQTSTALDDVTADLPYARRVADHLGVELHAVRVEPDRAADLERLVYELDEPLADPAALNTRLICELARQHGTTVMLSGQGADELFGGYRRHVAVAVERWWDRIPAAVRRPAAKILLARLPGYGSGPLGAFARRLVRFLRTAEDAPDRRLVEHFAWNSSDTRSAVLSSDVRVALRDGWWAGETHAAHLAEVSGESPLRQALHLDMNTFMPSLNLTYGDRMSMAVGVEMRVPFLDLDLVRWAWSLPDHLKLRGLTGTKHVLKRVGESVLPYDVVHRPKTGFGVPLRTWLAGDLREMVRDVLSPDSVAARGLFDPSGVTRVIEENERREHDHAYLIYAMLSLELWSRRMLDEERVSMARSAS